MKKLKILPLILCVILGSSFTQISMAQTISGTVIDAENHKTLDGATVFSKKSNSHTHTENKGQFKFSNAQYPDSLEVNFIGYESTIFVVKDAQSAIEIALQPSPYSLKQVDVNALRGLTKQITKVDLNQFPVNTAQDLLRKVPGLFIAQHAGGGKAEQIFLRGFDADHGTDVNISVDGMPVNMVSHAHGQGYADLHFLIPETVEDIDFGKGAYYADKGDLNTAGYVAFSTKNQIDNSLVKVETGDFGSFRTLAMLNMLHQNEENNSHPANAYIAAEYNFTNGPFVNPQNFNRINIFGKYNQWLHKNEKITLLASTFASNWNASGQIPERAIAENLVPRFGSLDPSEGGQTSRTNLQATYEKYFDDNSNFKSMVYYTKYDFSLFSNFTFFANNQDQGDEIHQYESRQIVGMDHRYTHTIDLQNSKLSYYMGTALRYDNIGKIGLDHVYRRNQLLSQSAFGAGTETNANIYGNIDWILGKFVINPGLRADYFVFDYENKLTQNALPTQQMTALRISPKFNIFYNPSKQLQFYSKSGMGFHSNDMRLLTQTNNAKQALPYSIGSDLGAVIKPFEGLIIQPALWYLHLQQEFVYVGDEAVVEAAGATERYGLELSLRYQPLHWLYIYTDGNYAHPRALGLPAAQSYIPLAPTFTSTGGATVQFNKEFSASLNYRYMKDRPGNEDNTVIAKGYYVNDLALTYQKKRWIFNLQAQNLFNTQWNEAQFYTETRLRTETENFSDMAITPGIPLFIKGSITVKF